MTHFSYKFFITFILITAISVGSQAQKIGFLLDSYITDRWYMDEKLFSEKVKELGGECIIVSSAYGRADEQLELAKKMITEDKVDVLVIVPSDAKKTIPIVAFAKENNVPVISYDRLILSKDVTLYVSFNNKKVGNLQAQYALKHAPEGKYLLINGPVSDNNAALFREGQLQILKPHVKSGKVTIMADIVLNAWSEIEAFMETQDLLLTHGEEPVAILAANDAIANGCIESIKSIEDFGKPIVTGQDADINGLKNILKGYQSMTVYKSIKSLATVAAEAAIKLAKKEAIPDTEVLKTAGLEVTSILLDPTVVDKSNYKETVVKDGHISLSEILSLEK